VDGNIVVYNMIAQDGIVTKIDLITGAKVPPIRYASLEECLYNLANLLKVQIVHHSVSIHGPRLGCGLAGGEWEKVEDILKRTLVERGLSVFIYDF